MKKLVLAMCGAALLLSLVGLQTVGSVKNNALGLDPGIPIGNVAPQTDY